MRDATGKIKYTELHVFEADGVTACLDRERKNVGRLSLSVGNAHYVFSLKRSDLDHLAHQIEQLFERPSPPIPHRKGRKT